MRLYTSWSSGPRSLWSSESERFLWSSGQEGLYVGIRKVPIMFGTRKVPVEFWPGRPLCRGQEGLYNVRNQEGSCIYGRDQEGLVEFRPGRPLWSSESRRFLFIWKLGTKKVFIEFEARKASLKWSGRPVVKRSRLIKP